MSKRSFIIAALAVILFIAAIFSVVMDFKPKTEAGEEPEVEPEPEKEPYQGTASNEIVDSGASVDVSLAPEQEKELKTRKTGKNG